jgi:hypothetical protein
VETGGRSDRMITMFREGESNRISVFYFLLFVGILFLSHEIGHPVIYDLLNPELTRYGLGAWIEVNPMGLVTKYYGLTVAQKPLVWAGGLLFTLPLFLLWRRLHWIFNSAVVGINLYGVCDICVALL